MPNQAGSIIIIFVATNRAESHCHEKKRLRCANMRESVGARNEEGRLRIEIEKQFL